MSSVVATQAVEKAYRPSVGDRHWLATAIMALAVVPMFRIAKLPLRIDILGMSVAYWYATAARAMCVAGLLAILAFPQSETIKPVLDCYRSQKIRIPFLFLLAAFLAWLFGWLLGLMLVADAIIVAELLDRSGARIGVRLADVIIPSAYFFIGLLLVFSLQHAIAGIKYAGAWDGYFNRLDARIFGCTVSQAATWSRTHLPAWLWNVATLAYYNVYGQVGAVLAIVALASNRENAIRYVGTMLTGYLIALVVFFLMPTMGPFALRDFSHSAESISGTIYSQQALPIQARLLWQHIVLPPVSIADYYIGFPSMHVAMPVIALWFVRRWRRLLALLVGFDVLIVLGIVLLEWHYFVDIVGGVAVALIAIALNPEKKAV